MGALTFHPLLPATQAAADAHLGFVRIADPFSQADQAKKDELRRAYQALADVDPGALLNEAEELERAVAKDPVRWASLAAEAERLRAKAFSILNPEMKEAA